MTRPVDEAGKCLARSLVKELDDRDLLVCRLVRDAVVIEALNPLTAKTTGCWTGIRTALLEGACDGLQIPIVVLLVKLARPPGAVIGNHRRVVMRSAQQHAVAINAIAVVQERLGILSSALVDLHEVAGKDEELLAAVLKVECIAKDIVVDARSWMQAVFEIAVTDEVDLLGLRSEATASGSYVHGLLLHKVENGVSKDFVGASGKTRVHGLVGDAVIGFGAGQVLLGAVDHREQLKRAGARLTQTSTKSTVHLGLDAHNGQPAQTRHAEQCVLGALWHKLIAVRRG